MADREQLCKKSLIYLGSSLLTQLLNLFLIPVYTHNFSTGQFGEFTLVTSLQSICMAFAGLGIFSGLSRFYYENADPNRAKNSAVTFTLLWGALNILITLAAAGRLAALIFGANPDGPLYIGLSAVNAVLASLISIYCAELTMTYRAWRSSLAAIVNLLAALLLTWWFLARLRLGIRGAVAAQSLAAAGVLLWLMLGDAGRFRLALDRQSLAPMLGYGLGLLPGQLGGWALTLLDRYLMKDLVSLNAVGVYSMGYKIGMLIQPLVMNPFKNIITPYKFTVYKAADGRARLRRLFDYNNISGWWVVLGLALFADPALRLLATGAYRPGFTVVPPIAAAYFLWSLAEFYSLGLHIANRTALDSGIVIGGAAINIGLNLLLIPRWGMHGAAVATLAAYALMTGAYFWAGQRYYRTGIHFWAPLRCGGLAALIYLGYYCGKPGLGDGSGTQLLWSAGLWLAYGGIGYGLGLLPAGAVRTLLERLSGGERRCGRKMLAWLGLSGK